MKLTPRGGVMLMAGGRVLLGAAVMAAPEQVVSRWLGEENAKSPAVLDLARGLAARDIALGVATLQTLGDPLAGPRIQAACAVADLVDCGATVLAREHLPLKGAVGTVVVAGAAAVAGFWWAHRLARL